MSESNTPYGHINTISRGSFLKLQNPNVILHNGAKLIKAQYGQTFYSIVIQIYVLLKSPKLKRLTWQ